MMHLPQERTAALVHIKPTVDGDLSSRGTNVGAELGWPSVRYLGRDFDRSGFRERTRKLRSLFGGNVHTHTSSLNGDDNGAVEDGGGTNEGVHLLRMSLQ